MSGQKNRGSNSFVSDIDSGEDTLNFVKQGLAVAQQIDFEGMTSDTGTGLFRLLEALHDAIDCAIDQYRRNPPKARAGGAT